MDKTQEIILRILQRTGSVSTFHLVKLVYLFDLAFLQIFGKTCTALPYEWGYYGPYCKDFEHAVWELEKEKIIKRTSYTTRKNFECVLHTALNRTPPRLQKQEEKIIAYIARKYAKMTTETLRDFVYNTPPMLDAQEKSSRFKRLNMKAIQKTKKIIIDPETAGMILDAEAVPDKDYLPAALVLKKIKKEIETPKHTAHTR